MLNIIEMRKVIQAVELAQDWEFDLSYWSRKTECGTVGCALGNYALRYEPQGFELDYDGDDESALMFNNKGVDIYHLYESDIMKYFGISENEFLYLFTSDRYVDINPSRKNVLARLKKFVLDKIFEYHAQLPAQSPRCSYTEELVAI